MPSFWRSAVGGLDRHRTTPELPAEADVVVIGAGYSSASFVTHFLASNSTSPSIVVLEARQLCSGASGRNGTDPKSTHRILWLTSNALQGGI